MKVSKGQSQPEIVAAVFLIMYMVLGRPFQYRVLIVTHLFISRVQVASPRSQGDGFRDAFTPFRLRPVARAEFDRLTEKWFP